MTTTERERELDEFARKSREAELQKRVDIACEYAKTSISSKKKEPRMLRGSSLNADSYEEFIALIDVAIDKTIDRKGYLVDLRRRYGEDMTALKKAYDSIPNNSNIEKRYSLEFKQNKEGEIVFDFAIVTRTWHPEEASLFESKLVQQKPPEFRGHATFEEFKIT